MILNSIAITAHQEAASYVLDDQDSVWNKKAQTYKALDYPYNPYVDIETWDKLKPYFLPYDHPIRPVLDKIFASERVTLNRESFEAAGFKLRPPKNPTNLVVGKHPRLKGYLVKSFLDIQTVCEWDNYVKRIDGAQSIQQCIENHGYQKDFKVPKKWLYPLPSDSSSPDDPQYQRRNFILLVEDMHILGHRANTSYYKNRITPEKLDALYVILTEVGLIDSLFKGNIPFNKSGKINFIDTEHHHLWPIKYERLLKCLSPKMQTYWQNLYTRE